MSATKCVRGSAMMDEWEVGCHLIAFPIASENRSSFLVTGQDKARQGATLNMQRRIYHL